MGSLHESAASLSFFGDDLDPSELSDRLGCQPTVGVRKGDTWLTSRGVKKVATTGSWRVRVERREPADLDGQINELLEGMSNDFPAWRSLAQRFRGRIFCGLFLSTGNEGLTLRPETLERIGTRGLLLDLDIYGRDMPD